jgi:acetyl-CoA acetyltransferase
MRDVYVIGAYTTAFKKHSGMSFGDLAREAYLATLLVAGMKNGADIEAGWLGGGKFIDSGATGPDGKLPVNTSDGLVSKGHPAGAAGLSMLAENGGGVIGMEEAVASVVILQRG